MKTKEYYGHECQAQPERVDQVYMYIRERPGINAPMICKDIVNDECDDAIEYIAELNELSEDELPGYLNEMYPHEWNAVCESIDYMLEEGCITFSDDGELNCVG